MKLKLNNINTDIMFIYPNNLKQFDYFHKSHMHYHFHSTIKRKLICFIVVSSFALLVNFNMSQQLSVTHPSIFNHFKNISKKTELNILNLEEWAERETLDFQDDIKHSINDIKSIIPKSRHAINLTDIEQWERKQRLFSKTMIDGIFWSSEVEAIVPSGPSDRQTFKRIRNLRFNTIRYLDSSGCGRDKNRFVRFEDGSNACCRYRDGSSEIMVQGELMSFYLGRLLGISNMPVVVLSEVKMCFAIHMVHF